MEDNNVVISLDSYRARAGAHLPAPCRITPPASARIAVRAACFFDLGSPYTYLAAERADRAFALLDWHPVQCMQPRRPFGDDARERIAARAADLRLPLVWVPERPLNVPRATRVAALAAGCGRAAEFVLAATRLTFAGSFDIEDPQILVVAGHAAGLDTEATLAAADDASRDGSMSHSVDVLRAAGATHLPAIRVGGTLFCGEERLPEAATAARNASRPGAGTSPDERPLASPDSNSQRAS